MAHTSNQELLLRIDTAAERLSVSRATLYRLIRSGEISTVRIGSAVRISAAALERWLATQAVSSRGGASS